MHARLTRRQFVEKIVWATATLGVFGAVPRRREQPIDHVLIRWPLPPLQLGARRVVAELDIRRLRKELARIAASPKETLLLKLDGVEAARQPGVVWQAYLTAPTHGKLDTEGSAFVGNVALFGAGIRSEPHFRPATFSFTADTAVAAALRTNTERLVLTFVPTGPLVGGKPTPPKPAANVRVRTVSFVVHPTRYTS